MKKIIISSALVVIGLATACKKEVVPTPNTNNSIELNSFHSQFVNQLKQNFTIDASIGGTIIANKGTKVTILPNGLKYANGQAVTGSVNIELVEIYDRGTMLLANKPTMGILPNGDLAPLVSGGEYYLKITQNGNALSTTNGVFVEVPTLNPDFGMQLFEGVIDINDNLTWDLTADSINFNQDSLGSNYGFFDDSWGWTNVDRFYDDPRPKTTIKVQLPSGFDNTNANVYITYDGEPTALASMDVFTTDGYFSEHYGLIPIGLEIHVIAITMIDGELNYAILPQTVNANEIMTISSFSPISEAALIALINDLP
jgi:hypothetical protein